MVDRRRGGAPVCSGHDVLGIRVAPSALRRPDQRPASLHPGLHYARQPQIGGSMRIASIGAAAVLFVVVAAAGGPPPAQPPAATTARPRHRLHLRRNVVHSLSRRRVVRRGRASQGQALQHRCPFAGWTLLSRLSWRQSRPEARRRHRRSDGSEVQTESVRRRAEATRHPRLLRPLPFIRGLHEALQSRGARRRSERVLDEQSRSEVEERRHRCGHLHRLSFRPRHPQERKSRSRRCIRRTSPRRAATATPTQNE